MTKMLEVELFDVWGIDFILCEFLRSQVHPDNCGLCVQMGRNCGSSRQ